MQQQGLVMRQLIFDEIVKSQKRCLSCESRSPELFEITGFPLPDQVEDKFRGNDKNGENTFLRDHHFWGALILYLLIRLVSIFRVRPRSFVAFSMFQLLSFILLIIHFFSRSETIFNN